jgi:hypothetical protein
MKITTTQVGIGAACLLGFSQCGYLSAQYQDAQARRATTDEHRAIAATDKAKAKAVAARSAIALERVKAGCLPVSQEGRDIPLTEGRVSLDTGESAPPGFACNGLGHTAEIVVGASGSRLAAIAVATPDDLPAYLEIYRRTPNATQPTPTQLAKGAQP